MIDYRPIDLLTGKPIRLGNNINLNIPTVEEMCYENNFSSYTRLFTIGTRELFSSVREVEELVKTYPTVWSMLFDEEGNAILGQMFQRESGTAMMFESLSYWSGLDKNGFKALGNKKIVHGDGGWIVDEEYFIVLSNLIIDIVDYVPNEDFIIPPPMNGNRLSDAQWRLWENTYKNRLRQAQKNGITIADKILILSVSFDAYLPIDEIMKMTIYHFNKLYDAVSKKESYQTQLEVFTSPKFDSKDSLKHWKELIKTQK